MTRITIPPAALEAGARAILREWTDLNSAEDAARAAIAAGLAAWPMAEMPHVENAPAFIILPLTENPDVE